MPSIKPISRFPDPVQSKFVAAGSTEEVYRFDVALGHVAFIYLVGTGSVPEGSEATWLVDGKVVEIPELGITHPITRQVASVEEPLLINPPLVVEKEVVWTVYSPVDAEFQVLMDGEVYKVPAAGVYARIVDEALEAVEVEKPEGIFEPITVEVGDTVVEVKTSKAWFGVSLTNDGDDPVYILLNKQTARREAPLKKDENIKLDMEHAVIERIFLVCDAGNSASVRLHPYR